MIERHVYTESERHVVLQQVHELLSTITPETVFVPWDDDIRPFDRVQDLACALKTEIRVRAQFPQERHIYGITRAKAQEHLRTFDATKDPRTAASLYALFSIAHVAFEGATEDLVDTQTLHTLYPLSHLAQTELTGLTDMASLIDELEGEYEALARHARNAAIHVAVTVGNDHVARQLLQRTDITEYDQYIYDLSRIQHASVKGNSFELSQLKSHIYEQHNSTEPEYYDNCVSAIHTAQLTLAIEQGDITSLSSLITEFGLGGRAAWTALHALQIARKKHSPYIPDIIHECQIHFASLRIEYAPPQEKNTRDTYLDAHPEIVLPFQYIIMVEEFMANLAYVDANHPIIDTLIWGTPQYPGLAEIRDTSEGMLHAETILRALALARKFTVADQWYEWYIQHYGESIQGKIREVYMEFVKNRETDGISDTIIEYSEEFYDNPQAYQTTWYDLLERKVFDRFRPCDYELLCNTMERIDTQTRTLWREFDQENPQSSDRSIFIGSHSIGRKRELFTPRTSELMAEIIERLLEDGNINGTKDMLTDPRLSLADAHNILKYVADTIQTKAIDAYIHYL